MGELRVENLHKRYGRKVVVHDVTLSMDRGEVVGFLGPNGAGKTTVFYSIVGFIQPTKGKIFLGDKNLTRQPMYRRARIGIAYLSQEASVFRKMSVADNIMAILETRPKLKRRERKERMEQLLEQLGLAEKRKQPAYTLSGGERRRTEIARALAIEPKFLLLDEPFAGIDPIAVYEIKTIVASLAKTGIGVLITDHNVRETLEITDRSYILKDGEIVVSGSRHDIMENEMARKVYLGETFRM